MSEPLSTSESLTVVGLGEALFDSIGQERVVLGGAPVNLAVHADQLLQNRGRGVVVSRVGQDDLGRRLIAELAERGMTTNFITQTSQYDTGMVAVRVNEEGHPTYQIQENVAWDHLEFVESWAELAPRCSAVCFGTLAQRSPESQAAIQTFISSAPQALKVCDLNLRQNFYSPEIIRQSLQAAGMLKLNEEELTVIGTALGFETHSSKIDDQVATLMRRFDLQMVALTRGAAGTVLFTPTERVEGTVPNYPRQDHSDTVGAGDSCCAAIIVGVLLEKPLQAIVELANRVGAFVASQPGATPILPREILERVYG